MSRLIFVKTSSLGDVVHNMPAVTDARRARPDAHIAWLVEEPYAPLVRLHPGVDAVFTVATRRWRKGWSQAGMWREARAAVGALRSQSYDEVIDTQGLIRTALLTRLARGRRHGYDAASIREPLASKFYDVRHTVDRTLHAIDRNRRLAGAALGYAPEGEIDYGLPRAAPPADGGYAMLLHGSAEPRKEWPEENWLAVARDLAARGLRIVLPWGSERERERAQRLAGQLGGAEVRGGEGLGAVATMIAGARIVVGLDTGLAHLAAAYAVPLVTIFTASDPSLTRPRGGGRIAIVGDRGVVPDVAAVIDAVQRM